MRHFALFAVGFCLLHLTGCGGSDDAQQVVSKLRVLGVRADAPDITMTIPARGLPSFSPSTVKLDALVADPKGGGRAVKLTWAACPPMDEEQSVDLTCDPPTGFALPAATFSPIRFFGWIANLPGVDLDRLMAEGGVSAAGYTGGFPLFVWLRADAGSDTAVAVKRITLVPDAARNQNPRLEGVDIDGVPLGPGVTFKADRMFTFLPRVDPASYEPYVIGGSEGTKTKTEEPLVLWYSSDGKFDSLQSSKDYPDNAWRSPKLENGETERRVDFWIVILDLRGGIDWIEVKDARVVP